MKFERFNFHQRGQHILMFVSFFICTFTGLPIKYSESWYAQRVADFFGGFDTMFAFHLTGASIMIASSVYHMIYLPLYALVKRKISIEVVPNLKDIRDLVHNIKFFWGREDQPPRFGRYSYKEKFDYWAVFWGIFIMVGSGLLLWFPEAAASVLPRWAIESSRVAHSDEAMLAILAIFIWHFFNVHFSPDFFPMNPVWYHGEMTAEMLKHEHPLEYEQLIANPTGEKAKKWETIPAASRTENN